MNKKSLIILTCAIIIGAGITAFFGAKTETDGDIPTSSYADTDFSKYDNLNSSAIGWGFKKNKGAPPDITDSVKVMFSKYNTYYMDFNTPKSLYLTFDEGYENGYTAQILDVLKETGTPAAFFVTAPYLEKETELVKRMIDEGHIVGNHTKNHPNLAKISPQKAAEELLELDKLFSDKYGGKMNYMRPPEGEYSERLLALANDLGYKTIFWSFAYRDWDVKNQKGTEFAYNSTVPYLHDGAILLLHAVSKDNANALTSIINYAKEQGYTFKSLDELS